MTLVVHILGRTTLSNSSLRKVCTVSFPSLANLLEMFLDPITQSEGGARKKVPTNYFLAFLPRSSQHPFTLPLSTLVPLLLPSPLES